MADEKKTAKVDPAAGADHSYDEPDKVVPEKGSAGHETPSGFALAKVGPDGDGDKYAAEKAKKRWGYA